MLPNIFLHNKEEILCLEETIMEENQEKDKNMILRNYSNSCEKKLLEKTL